MRSLGNLIDAALRIDLPYLVSLSLVQSSEDYVRLQREQMMEGLTESGSPIKTNLNRQGNPPADEYSYDYRKTKGKAKPIDLYDTGAFQGDIFLHVDDATKFVVDSADSKSVKLQGIFSTKIFGLNNEKKVELKPIAQRNLVDDYKIELAK